MDRPGGRPRRGLSRQGLVRALAAVALLAGTVAYGLASDPEPAQAAFNNPFPSDDFGTPISTIRADENLFVTGTSDFNGGRVCVVTPGSTETCAKPAWGTPNVLVSLGTTTGLIESAPLRAGDWQILSESFDSGAQKWVANAQSDTFRVFPCDGGCDTRIAQAQAQAWKAAAALRTAGAVQVCSAFAAADVVTAGQGLKKGVNKASVKKGNEALDAYSKSGSGFVGSAVGIGVVLVGFSVPDPFGNHEKGLQLLRDVSCTVSQMYQDIVDDPPDPTYDQVAEPSFATVDTLPDPGDSDLITVLDREARYGYAALKGYERYLGAVIDGNDLGICRQTQAVADNSYGQRDAMRDAAAELRRFAAKAAGDPELQGIVVSSADKPALVAYYERVRASGFDATETANLQALGFDAEDITLIRESFDLDIAQIPADQTLSQILSTFADGADAGAESFDVFGRQAEAVGQAVCGVNTAPVAFPGSVTVPSEATVPIGVSVYDADGDPLTYTITSGPAHGTLTGTAPPFTYTSDPGYTGPDPFTFRVDDGRSLSNEATQTINVAVNNPPIAYDDTFDVVPGLAKPFQLRGGDFLDGTAVTYTLTDPPDHGTASCNDAGACSYTADDTFTDGDTLTFTTFDGIKTSSPATVTFVPTTAAARDDAVTVSGSQVIDVAFNDSPAGAPVGEVTTPDHGTVSCSTYGVCLYVADDGYEGPDSFDYTLKVGASESTATVAVTVGAPPVAGDTAPSAGDDTLRTPVATPGTVDVLANDTGDGTLTVTAADGEEGTVTCTGGGRCTYTPTDDDFVGFDLFTYELSNGTDVDTGVVRVRVGARPVGLAVTGDPDGDGAAVAPGGGASWEIDVADDGPVETGRSRAEAVTATPTGPHGYLAGSAEAADGWSLSVDGDEVTATPGSGALIGDQATQVMPRPLPTISQGIGGDGHVPILVGSKSFSFFHHASPTGVSCVDRATGRVCPGYPKTVPVATFNTNGPGAVVGSQIWVHMMSNQVAQGQFQTSGLFCWDTATDQTCGLVTNRPGTELWNGTAPLLVDGGLWFATGAGRLRCIDPTTATPCSGGPIDTGITFTNDVGDIVNHGTKVYVSNFAQATCIDVATGERCPGWPDGGRDLPGNLVRSHDGTTGAIDGACGVGGQTRCVRESDPDTVVVTDVAWAITDTTFSSSVEAEAGTRTFWASNFGSGLGCFDWSTMAVCVGPTFDLTGGIGFSAQDTQGRYLPSAYGAVWDGSCAVAVGDSGQVFTMDFEGNSPCVSLDSGAAPRTIDLRRQRFDEQVGEATWDRVRVFDTDLAAGTSFTSFLVVVRDGDTGEEVARQDVVDTDGVVDLSGVDPVLHPSLTLTATARAVPGGAAWADGHAPKVQLLWDADAAPLSIGTVAADCVDGPVRPLVVTAGRDGRSARDELDLAAPPPCTPTTTTTTTTSTTSTTSTSTTSTTSPSSTTSTTSTTPGSTTSTTSTTPGSTTSTSTTPDGSSTTTSTTPGGTSTTAPDGTSTSSSTTPGGSGGSTTSPSGVSGAGSGQGGQGQGGQGGQGQGGQAQGQSGAQTPASGSSGGQGSPLARTGTEISWLTFVGAVIVAAGAAIIVLARRRLAR